MSKAAVSPYLPNYTATPMCKWVERHVYLTCPLQLIFNALMVMVGGKMKGHHALHGHARNGRDVTTTRGSNDDFIANLVCMCVCSNG